VRDPSIPFVEAIITIFASEIRPLRTPATAVGGSGVAVINRRPSLCATRRSYILVDYIGQRGRSSFSRGQAAAQAINYRLHTC
jgi:hypothetical protein